MRLTIKDIKELKNKRKITMLTAYDYPTAFLLDKAGIDIILVGDSLANVVLGLDSTTSIDMSEMIHHSKAVTRAVKNSIVLGDMPFSSYQLNPNEALPNAKRFITEASCSGVKLEWFDKCPEVTKEITQEGIPVMGHIGLTPQTAEKERGFKVQGREALSAKRLIEEAIILEDSGCFAIVLECVPDKLSEIITKKIKIPTIGIGAGLHCDGQVLVINDMLGLFERYTPKFVKKYTDLSDIILKAIKEYKEDILKERFPQKEHSFLMKEEELKKIYEEES
jgi:3-methyl-2-oxobutanoate hydroxymethyltransferase